MTQHLEGQIIETTYVGGCTEALVRTVEEQTPRLLTLVPRACWILDLSRVTTAERAVRDPGKAIFDHFKALNGDQFVVVVDNTLVKVMIKAIALATKLPLQIFTTRQEAITYLRHLS